VVAAAVLAGGRGSRFGGDRPKPLVRFRGRPLVAWAVDAAVASGLAPVLLVVGRDAREVAAWAPPEVEVVVNPDWERGIAWSLRAALAHLAERAEVGAVCVGLADQPLVGAEAYRRVAAVDPDAPLAVATYGGVRGNPVRLGRATWDAARALDGDEGARVLLRRGPTVEVPCDGTGDPSDVDTPADLAALEGRAAPVDGPGTPPDRCPPGPTS
jgi:CTP:molybdopterin cytidylyltransferase MocA